ncbi:MAG: hypothetical protein RL378_1070 [Actinomycetota bacterium]
MLKKCRVVSTSMFAKFSLAIALGFLISQIGIADFQSPSGSAKAVSTEGTADIVWSGSTLAIEWTSVDSNSSVAVSTGNETITDSDGEGSAKFPLAEVLGETISITWQRAANEEDFSNFDGSEDLRELVSSHPELFVITSTVGLPINDSAGRSSFIAPAQAATPSSTSFKYMTFIRENYVDETIWPGCELNLSVPFSYKGDNRGFNVDSPRFRTRMLVTVDWINGGKVSFSTAVGETKQYEKLQDGTYVFKAAKSAPRSSMIVSSISESLNSTKFRMRQDVINPFCSPLVAAGIYYDYSVALSRSGVYSVTGAALRVPNHEFYIIDAGQAEWTKIFARTGSDFGCLGAFSAGQTACRNSTPYPGTR